MLLNRFLSFSAMILIGVTAKAQQLAPDVVKSPESENRLQLYSETYTSPFLSSAVNFQRISDSPVKFGPQKTYRLFVGGERYADGETTNTTVEIGLQHPFTDSLFAVSSVRREMRRDSLNETTSSIWVARAGLIYSRFFNLSRPHTFADTYGEAFLRAPQESQVGLTASGWAKYGYRALGTNHWSLDPLIVMARFYDSTDRSLLGADYQSLGIGPQITFYTPKPEISVNAIATKSFSHSFTAPDEIINQYWFLLAIGANF